MGGKTCNTVIKLILQQLMLQIKLHIFLSPFYRIFTHLICVNQIKITRYTSGLWNFTVCSELSKSGAHQMEPASPLISWVNPFPSRVINRTACFPRKVSYFRESRMSPWKKWSWMKSNSEARPSTVFFFTIRPFLQFYSRWDLGIIK